MPAYPYPEGNERLIRTLNLQRESRNFGACPAPVLDRAIILLFPPGTQDSHEARPRHAKRESSSTAEDSTPPQLILKRAFSAKRLEPMRLSRPPLPVRPECICKLPGRSRVDICFAFAQTMSRGT